METSFILALIFAMTITLGVLLIGDARPRNPTRAPRTAPRAHDGRPGTFDQ